MRRRTIDLVFLCLCLCSGQIVLEAQEFRLFEHAVQIHGFASQGLIYTDDNNWLTLNSTHGSAGFTDFGLNVSVPITDKLRVGAQVYDRNLGQLGQYHPSLDWALADYRIRSWIGIRGGKVKTTLGLYNDTQDLDFLHPFALLPQSVYPTDLRDATIGHLGGDIYGVISLKHRLGDLSYTAFSGHRKDSNYSGYVYLSEKYGIRSSSYGGLQYGGDLRWSTPLKGLLVGVSRMNQDLKDTGVSISPSLGTFPYSAVTRADWTNQFYGEYAIGKLLVASEYRRFLNDQLTNGGVFRSISDVRGWYVSGAYRITRRLALGSYYSRYSITSVPGGPLAQQFPQLFEVQTDTSLPPNHVYDKVATARVDLKKFWYVKVEGHFMDGYGDSSFPEGFYRQVNPNGFKPNTDALVVKTGINF